MRNKVSILIIVSSIIIFSMIIVISLMLVNIDPEKVKNQKGQTSQSKVLTDKEKEEIDSWILKNRLNVYGDPYDTVYTGGVPTFNETTGETIDRFEYILKKHPDKPWKKK